MKDKLAEKTTKVMLESFDILKKGVEDSQQPLLDYLSKFSPEDLKNEETRKDYLAVMSVYQQNLGLQEAVGTVIKVLTEPKEEGENISSFGFLSDVKKAA